MDTYNKDGIMEQANDLLQMYKQGFLDGYISRNKKGAIPNEAKVWDNIKLLCLKTFQYRFEGKKRKGVRIKINDNKKKV